MFSILAKCLVAFESVKPLPNPPLIKGGHLSGGTHSDLANCEKSSYFSEVLLSFRVVAEFVKCCGKAPSLDKGRAGEGFKTLSAYLGIAFLGLILTGCDAAVPQTNLATAKEKSDQCVEPTEDMRKNHMVYLDVHRDKTVIEGIRTKKHSLNECINCHVAPTKADGEPLHYEDKEHFCASCHTYVGVKIDCFQCHADRPVLDDPNYQHKLSSHVYHELAANKAQPDLSDLLLVKEAEGVAQ